MTWASTRAIPAGSTVVGTVDGRTWTSAGDTSIVGGSGSVRFEFANALATALASFDVTISPYAPNHLDPPHIYIDFDSPFMEPATLGAQGPKNVVWAYLIQVVISAKKHQATQDWFERIAPYIIDACYDVPSARFHQFDAPEETEAGDSRYLVASGHVTVKRER